MDEKIGKYAFAVGVIISLILGLASTGLDPGTRTALISVLVLLGLVVGLLNVTDSETKDFLLTATVLIIAAGFGARELVLSAGSVAGLNVGLVFADLFGAILYFTVPAVVVVSVKHIWFLASD